MKKSLLLLPLLALPTFTLAEVQLYGTVKSGIETSRTKIGDTRYSQTAVRDYDSHLGIILLYCTFNLPFAIWTMRGIIEPREFGADAVFGEFQSDRGSEGVQTFHVDVSPRSPFG